MKYFQYNIFAKSLGSNTIPWVMTISLEWKHKIESIINIPYHLWIKNMFTNEYRQHFHKNYASGDKILMRNLWSKEINSSRDIPPELTGLAYLSENCIKYEIDGTEHHAVTLPGLLKKTIPTVAHELYRHIMDLEVFYNWESRGPCIYRTILESEADIVSLCEYDIHDAVAGYRTPSLRETFADAMLASGYSGLFLHSPDPRGGSGLGLFWKAEDYELATPQDRSFFFEFPNVSSINIDLDIQGVISNLDLHEHWNKLSTKGNNLNSDYSEMPKKDRRHAGFVRLRHKKSEKYILIVSTHLMTSSRDSKETNEYPGEVRLGEMEIIGSKISSILNNAELIPVDAILYSGDFNVDIRELKTMNKGITSILEPSKVRHFNIGLYEAPCESGIDFGPRLRYHPNPRWIMQEAFESVHLWGIDGRIGYDQYCTSYNSNRCEWIDMIWYTPQTLLLKSLSSMDTPLTPIPNNIHGSDHLPLCAEFEWK